MWGGLNGQDLKDNKKKKLWRVPRRALVCSTIAFLGLLHIHLSLATKCSHSAALVHVAQIVYLHAQQLL
jgi:hypothetical protein